MPLRFQRPSLPSMIEIDSYLELSRKERWFSNEGPCWRLLSKRLAEIAGAYCIPVASGTAGLMAAIAAVSERSPHATKKALMPSFTFLATAEAALWAGLEPLWNDIDGSHWHLDPEVLEEELRDHHAETGLVLAVSAFGTPPPGEVRQQWEDACRRAAVPLVVDSAAAFGAVADDNLPVGSQGDVEVVSFHATKPFAIGEGGAVFTRSRALFDRISMIVNFGLSIGRTAEHAGGLNAKMSELHAATALAVLDRYDAILEARRRSALAIRQVESEVAWQTGCERSTWQFVPVAFPDQESRDDALKRSEENVQVRVYYEPLHQMSPFTSWPASSKGLQQTEDLTTRILCLPMANDLTANEIEDITSVLVSPAEDVHTKDHELDSIWSRL